MLTLIALACIGFVGGIGITAIGAGGILPTIGLFALTPLAPAQVAGTAIVTNVLTGAAGTAAYHRSGQLSSPAARRTVWILGGTALVGTPLGIVLNSTLSARGYGLILAVVVAAVAIAVALQRRPDDDEERVLPSGWVAVIGFAVAVVAGLVGIGGPLLTVPLLVVVGARLLDAVAVSQVQSVVIAGAGAVGYLASGSIDWLLAAVVGLPQLAGVFIGWRVARALPTVVLKRIMVVVLLLIAPYLALSR